MRNKLIININIYCILLRHTKSQYNPPVYSRIQQGYIYPYQNAAYPQYQNHKIYKDYENIKWPVQHNVNYEDYNEYEDDNQCPCDKCDELKPSCKDMCPNCLLTPSPVIAPNYVFLPFPYPYPVTPNSALTSIIQTTETSRTPTDINNETTRKESTSEIVIKETTVKSLTSEALIVSSTLPEENNEVLRDKFPFNVKNKGQYMLTSLRRTKPNWLPKYGIVPISDKFAEKLMLQLRSMRVLHPQKDNIRNIDEITP